MGRVKNMGKRNALQAVTENVAGAHKKIEGPVKKAKMEQKANEKTKLRAPTNAFDNPQRIDELYSVITSDKLMQQKKGKDSNKDRLKQITAGREKELSPEVSLWTYPGGTEVVVKTFDWEGEFGGAFQEISGGVV